jgi:thiamine biosynthesis lipoprotein
MHIADAGHNDGELPHAPEMQLAVREAGIVAISFVAMASPCEVLLETDDLRAADTLGRIAAREAWRIEAKFSRYQSDSVVSAINRSAGRPVVVDEETAALINYAAECHALSEGRFDITSGVLRRCWKFDCSDHIPDAAAVAALLPLIGFEKISWHPPQITLPAGMEIDFGGFGKEYAVDRVLTRLAERSSGAVLVNFGGDLATNRPPAIGPWSVGVERPDARGEARLLLELERGALATSGDTHRYLLRDGVRYSHILDVRTGWPVPEVPRSVSVVGSTCVEAGMLATLSMLHGGAAESFLELHAERYWCLR